MSAELVKTSPRLQAQLQAIPPVPWRDLQSVPAGELRRYIETLEAACLENPASADLRTCLGLAYAVNYDVYKSLDALETATKLDPAHFWAQLKYAELHYRLRALPRAEQEAARALDLAQNGWHLALARKQLQEIRALNRVSTRNITLDKPLMLPALVLSGMVTLVFIGMTWLH
jgi:cytochrome c-type biogenesis protein CcmH/NrfG